MTQFVRWGDLRRIEDGMKTLGLDCNCASAYYGTAIKVDCRSGGWHRIAIIPLADQGVVEERDVQTITGIFLRILPALVKT